MRVTLCCRYSGADLVCEKGGGTVVLPDSGVEVIHRLQRSDDKGASWSDTDVSAGPGESLVVPFENGVLFRVNTVLK